jgi:hypothetical protein
VGQVDAGDRLSVGVVAVVVVVRRMTINVMQILWSYISITTTGRYHHHHHHLHTFTDMYLDHIWKQTSRDSFTHIGPFVRRIIRDKI